MYESTGRGGGGHGANPGGGIMNGGKGKGQRCYMDVVTWCWVCFHGGEQSVIAIK